MTRHLSTSQTTETDEHEHSGDQSSPQPAAKRWLQVVLQGWQQSTADQVPLLAAGVAFFGFLALFPAMVAFTLIWGLVADPASVTQQAAWLTQSLPEEARGLVEGQLQQLAGASGQSLGWGLVVAVLIALWSTSGGVGNLINALTAAYGGTKTRGFVKDKLTALALTLGAIVFMVVMVALIAGVPVVLQVLGVGDTWRWLSEVVRWLLIVGLLLLALAVLYRVAPDRREPRMRWISEGAVVAALVWLVASIGFSLYVSLFGNYAKTYGALAGVVVLQMWLWLTSFAILLGAEINAAVEGRDDA